MDFRSQTPWRERPQASIVRGGVFDPLVTFRREVDRIFDDFFNGFGGIRPTSASFQGVVPVVDVEETDGQIVVTAEVPGLDEKDFEVTVSGGVLTIKGEKKAEHEQKGRNGYYMERRFGSFCRSVDLPYEVKDEDVEARYDKGVLTIRIPKPEGLQKSVRRIEVKAH
jgi:HSP20 family protein